MAKAKAKNYLLKTITIESVPEIGLNLTVVPVVPEVALIDCDSVIFPSLLREKKTYGNPRFGDIHQLVVVGVGHVELARCEFRVVASRVQFLNVFLDLRFIRLSTQADELLTNLATVFHFGLGRLLD